ncbi:hypothetical protein Cni_G04798 [Canna indica]|uniref:Uncharacterized protein n=1 Tax=Canna indica TaxID=4628 RepID=A0AAQ3JU51_9LILI|nr:hypothetical protein Cni_G04798 [Canna indica]
MTVSDFHSFSTADLDMGLGRPVLVLPETPKGRLNGAFLQVASSPKGDGSWIVTGVLWPKLADAFESDGIFKPVTAHYLGLVAPTASGVVSKL